MDPAPPPDYQTLLDESPNFVYSEYDRTKTLPWAEKSITSVLVEDFYLYEPNLIAEVFRVLSPGGRALLHTTNPICESDYPRVSLTCKAIGSFTGHSDGLAASNLLTTPQNVGFAEVRGEKILIAL